MSVYRVTEIVGTSESGWADAAKQALEAAAGSLRDLRVADVVAQDVTLGPDGRIEAYRVRMQVSFKVEQDAEAQSLVVETLGF
ncbi:dodecin family protein [Phenylobacterium sp.]|uniref:dodecin family protein n=1 Tax=Phenylobacterium sp. TaxID=1871053 RepID=UPI002FCC064E